MLRTTSDQAQNATRGSDDARGELEARPAPTRIAVDHLDAWFGRNHAVRHVSLAIPDRQVTAVIGPSGCGKSTFLRCLNRMHETVPNARVSGHVLLGTHDIYAPGGFNPAWATVIPGPALLMVPLLTCISVGVGLLATKAKWTVLEQVLLADLGLVADESFDRC